MASTPRTTGPVGTAGDDTRATEEFLAHRELKAAVEANRAKAGSLVILDARTGEVLALVNQPDYNPNNRAAVTGRQTRNRSVTDLFEPGSTLKPFSVAAALDDGIVKPTTMIDTSPLKIGGWTINDSHPMGTLSVAQVIAKSSNIGTARIQRWFGREWESTPS